MHPIDHYTTIRRGQEELLRQAERERMLRIARINKLVNRKAHLEFASWLGTHLVRWGQKLEHFGTPGGRHQMPSTSPHH